jgi:hypothetical protein
MRSREGNSWQVDKDRRWQFSQRFRQKRLRLFMEFRVGIEES